MLPMGLHILLEMWHMNALKACLCLLRMPLELRKRTKLQEHELLEPKLHKVKGKLLEIIKRIWTFR